MTFTREANSGMKLYELPRDYKDGIKIYEACSDGSKFFRFHHIDGAYSYCTTEKGAVVHIGASTKLVDYKDGFKLDTL